jgi:hypothetical protein
MEASLSMGSSVSNELSDNSEDFEIGATSATAIDEIVPSASFIAKLQAKTLLTPDMYHHFSR